MPIRYADYPRDWKERRARILTRACNRCEVHDFFAERRGQVVGRRLKTNEQKRKEFEQAAVAPLLEV
jgi:hypothetical protein